MKHRTAVDLPRSARGLDAFNALVASVQTGFGPFLAVYLASEAWTQRDIGAVLSLGTIVGMVSQMPGGAVVDAMRNKRLAALSSCIAVAGSALLLAVAPTKPTVLGAEALHGFASCMLAPAIAAVSLQLVGRLDLGERLGRNARWSAIGSGVAAAVMGAVGSYVSEASVFWLTAALMLPALLALRSVRMPTLELEPAPAVPQAAWRLMIDRRVLAVAFCVGLFHLSNAAILPLVGANLTRTLGSQASLVIAACIVLPQLLVAALSPLVGRRADRWGRRPLLLLSFAVLPLRAGLLAAMHGPFEVVAVQMLDGVSAAGFGVLVPLIAADLTKGTGRFNLCMGTFGLAMGLGATFSTTMAGVTADAFGVPAALLALAGAGLLGVLAVAALVRESTPILLE